MNVRQTNLTLWSICGVLYVVALAILVAAVALPLQQTVNEPSLSSTKKPRLIPVAAPTTQAFQSLYARTFRVSLDPAAATAAAATAARSADMAAPSEIQLIGTVGAALAILKGPDGSDALAELGDDVNGAVITAIRPSEIELRNPDGSKITLHRPADSDVNPVPTTQP